MEYNVSNFFSLSCYSLIIRDPQRRNFRVSKHFPPLSYCDSDGVLAYGGDLSVELLVEAYSRGIFPWPSCDFALIPWVCPEERFILPVEELHVPKSLRRVMRHYPYKITMDNAFSEVIHHCASVYRHDQDGTWIIPKLIDGYCALHEVHLAHSVEAWDGERLVGGLYGVSLGDIFFGESMFALSPDASKIAFVSMVEAIRDWGIKLIDCQVYTDHLARFGAKKCTRDNFMRVLENLIQRPTRQHKWEIRSI